jgi:hypothetical protein
MKGPTFSKAFNLFHREVESSSASPDAARVFHSIALGLHVSLQSPHSTQLVIEGRVSRWQRRLH